MFEIKKILFKVKGSEFLKDSFFKYYFALKVWSFREAAQIAQVAAR